MRWVRFVWNPETLVLAVVLSGCVTDRPWVHATKVTQQEFLKDKTDCRVKAGQACPMGGMLPCSRDRAFDECLMGEGWSQAH